MRGLIDRHRLVDPMLVKRMIRLEFPPVLQFTKWQPIGIIVLPLFTRATVYGSLDVPSMLFGIPWRRVNRHPAFSVAKPTVDHAPCMGTRSRLSDRPALLFRMCQSCSNKSVWMASHVLALLLLVFQLQQLYHHGRVQQSRPLQPFRVYLDVTVSWAFGVPPKGSITFYWSGRVTAHAFWLIGNRSPVTRRSAEALGYLPLQ